MVKKVNTAIVKLWGNNVGAVSWLYEHGYAVFEYDSSFIMKGLDISPLHMRLEEAQRGSSVFSFPHLGNDNETFRGLPGLLADTLPDKFGNSIIDAWLTRMGRDIKNFNPVERLCYTGTRGMGALEFSPPINTQIDRSVPVEVSELVGLAQKIMSQQSKLDVSLGSSEKENEKAIMDIIRVGTSAGGARPKAIIAMDKTRKNIISGQAEGPKGYDHWILKFDGVHDLELGAPKGYGRIEYAYHLMAKAAGIEMTECSLLEENGRAHFLTKRFDRKNGEKIHMQTLCGLAHYDYNIAGAYSYEQAFSVMRQLRLNKAEAIQQYRRMVFNVIARNQDDHTKNITYLMNKNGNWKLSPAYDVIYQHNPAGKWTNLHQMSINGKRDNFMMSDLEKVGESISISKSKKIIKEIEGTVKRWPEFAREAQVEESSIKEIAHYHRTNLT